MDRDYGGRAAIRLANTLFLHGSRLWRQSRHTPCEHAYCLRQYGVFHFFSKKLKKEFDTHIEDAYKPASPTGWMTSERHLENRIEESDREK